MSDISPSIKSFSFTLLHNKNKRRRENQKGESEQGIKIISSKKNQRNYHLSLVRIDPGCSKITRSTDKKICETLQINIKKSPVYIAIMNKSALFLVYYPIPEESLEKFQPEPEILLRELKDGLPESHILFSTELFNMALESVDLLK